MTYSPSFLDCFLNPKHAGSLDCANLLTASHKGAQPFSDIQFFFHVKKGIIKQASFLSSTTPVLIAGCEYVCRRLEGLSLADANGLQKEQILQELDLESVFVHAAHLICTVFKKALEI